MATDKSPMEDTEEDVDASTPAKGVKVSEEFQTKAHALINGATKAECSFIQDSVYTRQEELRKKDNKDKPEFSDVAMPSDS